jgi:hypothetical protein
MPRRLVDGEAGAALLGSRYRGTGRDEGAAIRFAGRTRQRQSDLSRSNADAPLVRPRELEDDVDGGRPVRSDHLDLVPGVAIDRKWETIGQPLVERFGRGAHHVNPVATVDLVRCDYEH